MPLPPWSTTFPWVMEVATAGCADRSDDFTKMSAPMRTAAAVTIEASTFKMTS